ncbi:MAG: YitT family protein [Spirochaetaceae bacterium]|jgi:uncharacterized membrane-anchored protein YitT (DUF2179 family)|nr:YitT family protein [Spirochaetaceae bacterium]
MQQITILSTIKRSALLVAAAALFAFNLKTFCVAAGIIPGGFTGIAILFNEIMQRYAGINLPFSIVYYVLNMIPVYIGFRYIGKWFTLYSCFMVVLTGLFTDWMPSSLLEYLNLHDYLLCAVFGGIISAIAITICLNADATSGGTDFIAIYFSEKHGADTWNYIFAANCVILMIAAVLFGAEKALYSIIYQFASMMGITSLYKGYQCKTLLIITNKPNEIYALIRDKTRHDATLFTGVGSYSGAPRSLLYSVVASTEVHSLVSSIKEIDNGAFINVLRTDLLHGSFYKRPRN